MAVPLSTVLAVAVRPWLWATAIGAVFALAPRRWWAHKPYLPIPDASVVRWRLATAYGSSSTEMTPEDVVSYLEWRRTNTS
jgi:hypothetical protein